ncbi:hypothetical protein EDB80DRAFT_714744 [Ilyonectria destructans]|nr:hypothetical protein EDB80DRAFT_714744 [Ilyonectria destructans]
MLTCLTISLQELCQAPHFFCVLRPLLQSIPFSLNTNSPVRISSYILSAVLSSLALLQYLHVMRPTTILASLAAFGIASTRVSRCQHSPSGTTTADITPTTSPVTQPDPTSVFGNLERQPLRLWSPLPKLRPLRGFSVLPGRLNLHSIPQLKRY